MTETSLHPINKTRTFAEIILPLALAKPYTYSVPEELLTRVQAGVRVEVQFGKNKLYSGLVLRVHQEAPDHRTKAILSVIDESPIALPSQMQFWQWMARYYCCSMGEVMHAALPANLKLASETVVTLSPAYDGDHSGLNDQEYLVAEALTIQHELSVADIQQIVQQQSVYSLLRRMLEKRIIYLKEDLKEKFKPKTVTCVRLAEPFASDPETLGPAFDQLSKATRQVEALVAFIQLSRQQPFIRRDELCKLARVDTSVLNALVKKGVLEYYSREVSRLGGYEEATVETEALSPLQVQAMEQIRSHLDEKNVVLVHGVTGSGKTRLYIELIRETIRNNEQALYLLPEIALTTQIIDRLKKVFGNDVAIYHSRLNNHERVEVWNQVLGGKAVVLGPRSALFLPFDKLKLIIVDEEHDPSYKQQDPNPRYNGRDAAVYLAQLHGARIVLGTATPSMESYFNAKSGKYGLVELSERFGGLEMPELQLVDVKAEIQERKMQSLFSSALLDELRSTLARGEQAILFQNRRGYAPAYRCTTCGWCAECIHCDVSLTYHMQSRHLKCHYCNYTTNLPQICPACGGKQLALQGFGTEKIEDELKIYLPDASIGRMDYDTVRTKHAHAQIINDFEEGRIQILVGTQMVTKGLDFERVGLVGILSADQLLQFPDFRAAERAFQLMIQVSGRAGRKHRRGKVLIQALNTAHPVLREVLEHDFFGFFQREMQERYHFKYPPYYRLIRITLKHTKPEVLNKAATIYGNFLSPHLGQRLRGPAVPPVARVRGFYLIDFLLKLEKDPKRIEWAKDLILAAEDHLHQTEGYSGVRVNVDVDPV